MTHCHDPKWFWSNNMDSISLYTGIVMQRTKRISVESTLYKTKRHVESAFINIYRMKVLDI